MRRHSVLSLTAAGAVAVLGLSVAAAPAASAATPARGSASSALSLLEINVGGTVVKTVNALGSTSTLSNPLAQLAITPVMVGSTSYGKQTITPASGSKTISAPSAPALPGNLAQLASPVLTAAAALPVAGPFTALGATSLGSAKLLNLPLSINGALSQTASTAANVVGHTGLQVDSFSLPSINDLLGALGLDLSALPVSTLNNLLTQLQLPTAGLNAANTAVAAAQTAAHSTIDRLRNATTLLTTRQGVLASAQNQLTNATATLTSVLNGLPLPVLAAGGLLSAPTTAVFEGLSSLLQAAMTALSPALAAADAAFDAAQNLVTLAGGAVTTATGLVTSLTNLGDLVKGVLDGTPLASLTGINLSAATSAGKTLSSNVTGTITGLKVLGTDVLKVVTGSSSIDVLKLVGTVAGEAQGVVDAMMGTLQDILSTVPGVSGLSLPMPQVKVMDVVKSAKTFTNGSQEAIAKVSALTVSLSGFRIPSALGLANALSLPGISSVTGGILNKAFSVSVGNVEEHSVFLPAGVTKVGTVVATPKAPSTGALASTGFNPIVAFAALLVTGLGVALRRRMKLASATF